MKIRISLLRLSIEQQLPLNVLNLRRNFFLHCHWYHFSLDWMLKLSICSYFFQTTTKLTLKLAIFEFHPINCLYCMPLAINFSRKMCVDCLYFQFRFLHIHTHCINTFANFWQSTCVIPIWIHVVIITMRMKWEIQQH